MLLIVGGEKDFNLRNLVNVCQSNGVDYYPILLSNESGIPSMLWDLQEQCLVVGKKNLQPTSIFFRTDVFQSIDCSPKTMHSFFQNFKSYGLAYDQVKMFNKYYKGMDKASNLVRANRFGLKIPRTILSNKFEKLSQMVNSEQFIVKPNVGGKLTTTLKTFLTETENDVLESSISFIQNKLDSPEYRVFTIGDTCITFKIESSNLDYRNDKEVKVSFIENMPKIENPLKKLADHLKLDFSASDFKTCPLTGDLVFLEINSNPMFGRFDRECDHLITKTMIQCLQNRVFATLV